MVRCGPGRCGGEMQARAEQPRRQRARHNGDEPGRQPERPAYAARIADQDQQRRKERDQRRAENLEDEPHRNDRDRHARQGRKQRRARRVPPHPRAEKRGGDFHHATEESRHQRHFPRQMSALRAFRDKPVPGMKKMKAKRLTVFTPNGKRGHRVSPCPDRKPVGLPRVERFPATSLTLRCPAKSVPTTTSSTGSPASTGQNPDDHDRAGTNYRQRGRRSRRCRSGRTSLSGTFSGRKQQQWA